MINNTKKKGKRGLYIYIYLPGEYIVIQPGLIGSPMTTAIAPLCCIYLTLVIKEHFPLETSAIQSVVGASTRLHPVISSAGSIKNPIFPLVDNLGPNDAILS